jgi:hypothetical protein
VKRLTFLAKGNIDVHDSLHSRRIGGGLPWNGTNDVLRRRHARLIGEEGIRVPEESGVFEHNLQGAPV